MRHINFTARELAVCAVFGAAIFLISFTLGQFLVAATGIPMIGGLAHVIFDAAILVVGAMLVRKSGVATIILVIDGILAVPTASAGPPGIYKIGVMLLVGLVFELVLIITQRKKVGYVLAPVLSLPLSVPVMYFFLTVLSLPGAEKLQSAMAFFMIAYIVLAAIGAALGLWIFGKIKDRSFVRQIQR